MSNFQIQNSKFQIIFIISLLVSLFATTTAFAAELNIVMEKAEVYRGEIIPVKVLLNTENESINAIGIRIRYSESIKLKSWSDGNSIVNFWIEKPKIEDSGLSFSGIIPGGYQGKEGLILTLNFEALREGSGIITFLDASQLFLNDGLGTKVAPVFKNLNFNISTPIEKFQIPDSKFQIPDTESPESFVPEIAKDPTLFNGKWFVVFATQDKGSGIDHYLIHESRRMKKQIATNQWVVAESPYILKDQDLRSYIYIKAVDKTGHERIVAVPPQYPLKWYEMYENWVIIILVAILVFVIWYNSNFRNYLRRFT